MWLLPGDGERVAHTGIQVIESDGFGGSIEGEVRDGPPVDLSTSWTVTHPHNGHLVKRRTIVSLGEKAARARHHQVHNFILTVRNSLTKPNCILYFYEHTKNWSLSWIYASLVDNGSTHLFFSICDIQITSAPLISSPSAHNNVYNSRHGFYFWAKLTDPTADTVAVSWLPAAL